MPAFPRAKFAPKNGNGERGESAAFFAGASRPVSAEISTFLLIGVLSVFFRLFKSGVRLFLYSSPSPSSSVFPYPPVMFSVFFLARLVTGFTIFLPIAIRIVALRFWIEFGLGRVCRSACAIFFSNKGV